MRAASRAAECGGTREEEECGKREQKCRKLSIYFYFYFRFAKKQLGIAQATVFTSWGGVCFSHIPKTKGYLWVACGMAATLEVNLISIRRGTSAMDALFISCLYLLRRLTATIPSLCVLMALNFFIKTATLTVVPQRGSRRPGRNLIAYICLADALDRNGEVMIFWGEGACVCWGRCGVCVCLISPDTRPTYAHIKV